MKGQLTRALWSFLLSSARTLHKTLGHRAAGPSSTTSPLKSLSQRKLHAKDTCRCPENQVARHLERGEESRGGTSKPSNNSPHHPCGHHIISIKQGVS